jgi:hypothetical protein
VPGRRASGRGTNGCEEQAAFELRGGAGDSGTVGGGVRSGGTLGVKLREAAASLAEGCAAEGRAEEASAEGCAAWAFTEGRTTAGDSAKGWGPQESEGYRIDGFSIFASREE